MSRDTLAREALRQVPALLTLLDRNPHSPTYGCFERIFWHYRIIDFPSGMSQEYAWPIALAYATPVPGNAFYQQLALAQWAEAALVFAARWSHRDGSCDDYFPYERAAGASAFSMLAALETCRLLGIKNDEVLGFIRRRADWLAHREESGRLTNHHALIMLCLDLAGRLLNTDRWCAARDQRLQRVLDWQNPEGWFIEYEGCDPGYHTLTLSCLAWLHRSRPDDNRLKDSLVRAVKLADLFVHPDGTFGGEYGNRNTYNFFPHGFEIVGRWMPEALSINDRFLAALARGEGPSYTDDHVLGHFVWSYLVAWNEWVERRPGPPPPRKNGRIELPQAGIIVERRGDADLYLATNKAGVFKLFRNGRLAASDTGLSLLVRDGRHTRNAVSHLRDEYRVELADDQITIDGSLAWAKHKLMTPVRMIVLRVIMLTWGRFFPDVVRRLLQRMLIVGRKAAPFDFRRTLWWEGDALKVRDELTARRTWDEVEAAGIGGGQTSIHVVMSRVYHPHQLQDWLDLTPTVRKLRRGEPLVVERTL